MGNEQSQNQTTEPPTTTVPLLKEAMTEDAGQNRALTAQERCDLMDLALKNVETVLGELKKHPYKVDAKKSEDNTRGVVKLYRGRIAILLFGFLAGACILTILCQRMINPWYKWNFHVEVDKHGKIGVKFSGARNKVTYCLTCILGSCVLAYFSSKEHKKVHHLVMETLQTTTDKYFSDNSLGTAPTVVDLNDDDGKDDSEFLANEP